MASNRLILSLLPMLATVANSSPSNNCSHVMAGLMKMSSGIDITKLDLFPLLGTPDDSHGFVANVFNYTCSGEWNDTEFGMLYGQVPDQVEIDSQPIHATEQIKFVQDMIGVKKLLMDRVNLYHEEERIEAFSGNSKYTSLLKQFYESDKTFTEIILTNSVFCAWNEITNLSEDFVQRAKKLPAKYEDNPTIYREFVLRFGTHYFDKGCFTYDSYIQFAINRTYMFDTEDSEIEENMKRSFLNYWPGSPINWPNESMLNDRLKKNSEIVLAYGKNNSKWVDKVGGVSYELKNFANFPDPIMTGATLIPLDGLIGLIADNKKSQLRIAIRMYRIEAYLNELKNVYNFSADYQLSEKEKATLKEVEQLIKSNNVLQIEEMVNMIDELYNKVQLFKVKQFYGTILYDAYVTAGVKLQFVKRVCAAKWMCPHSDIVYAQDKIEQLYQEYGEMQNYQEYRRFVKKARKLNVKFQIRTDQGWRFSCVSCWPF